MKKIKKYQPTLSLKPTQFSVGLLEVEYKVLQLKKASTKKLARILARTKIPVVISPWNELCVTDHHHFLFACWHVGIQKVRVEVIKDYSHSRLSYHKFWQKLASERRAYLYDQFGDGPKKPLYLPMDVRGMADDPYRSLAWMVRKEGAYTNSSETFCEFKWADFFRKRALLDSQGRGGFHKAIPKAIKLAQSDAAKNLPGFINRKKLDQLVDDEIGPKSKFVPRRQKKGELASVPLITA